jgi:hypothetical protein
MARLLQGSLTKKEYFIGAIHAFVIQNHQLITII